MADYPNRLLPTNSADEAFFIHGQAVWLARKTSTQPFPPFLVGWLCIAVDSKSEIRKHLNSCPIESQYYITSNRARQSILVIRLNMKAVLLLLTLFGSVTLSAANWTVVLGDGGFDFSLSILKGTAYGPAVVVGNEIQWFDPSGKRKGKIKLGYDWGGGSVISESQILVVERSENGEQKLHLLTFAHDGPVIDDQYPIDSMARTSLNLENPESVADDFSGFYTLNRETWALSRIDFRRPPQPAIILTLTGAPTVEGPWSNIATVNVKANDALGFYRLGTNYFTPQ